MPDRRRSLTIKEENDKKIQNIRAKFLIHNIDIDYTAMINIFIELADKILKENEKNIEITDIFMRYIDDANIDDISEILNELNIINK